jgi:hypothetical protein
MRLARARTGLVLLLLCSCCGCAFLLPRTQSTTKSKWGSYEEARAAFEQIVPNETRVEQLNAWGFDPTTNPNVKVLTYLDVVQRFMPNPSITKEDLDEAVRKCIDAREQSKSHETGWQFSGLLLIRDGRVVYKLASGQPHVDRHERRVRPLGPLQEFEGVISRVAGSL